MRYAVLLTGLGAVIAGTAACPGGVRAGPVVVAQAEGGGIGGSLAAPAARTVRAKPRPRPAPAAVRSAPAPRVIVKREVVYQPRYIERPAAPEPRRRERAGAGGGLASYDGVWTVSSNGCSAAGTSQVMISGGHISASNGSGRVSPSGAVSIVSAVNGLTIAGQGQITGGSASGIFLQSDGCAGSWSAVRL